MADDGNVVARRAAQTASIASLLLHIRHDGTFGNGTQREDVADRQAGLLPGIDELARVHALVGDERLGVQLEPVRVPEDDLREGGASAGIVDYVLDDAACVAVALGIVEVSELGGCLSKPGVGGEDAARTFSLVADLIASQSR